MSFKNKIEVKDMKKKDNIETIETFVVSIFSDAYGIIWHLMQFVI